MDHYHMAMELLSHKRAQLDEMMKPGNHLELGRGQEEE